MENASSLLQGFGIDITIDGFVNFLKFAEKLISNQAREDENNLFSQILKIVEPFADKTFSTIPSSAVVNYSICLAKILLSD